jgi:hypothetical protein
MLSIRARKGIAPEKIVMLVYRVLMSVKTINSVAMITSTAMVASRRSTPRSKRFPLREAYLKGRTEDVGSGIGVTAAGG